MRVSKDPCVPTDLNTLLTALYVKVDDELGGTRCIGGPPLLSDSELICLAVAHAMSASTPRPAGCATRASTCRACFPYLPQRAGYSKRLRAALPLIKRMIRELAMDSDFWTDTVWITDSTPVPCRTSRPTVREGPRRAGRPTAEVLARAGEAAVRGAGDQEGSPGDRVGQRHPQRTARPGRTRRRPAQRAGMPPCGLLTTSDRDPSAR